MARQDDTTTVLNAVRRLHQFLTAFSELSEQDADGTRVRDVLSDLYDIDSDNDLALHRELWRARQLLPKAQSAVAASGANNFDAGKICAEWSLSLRRFFNGLHLDEPASLAKSMIDKTTLASLFAASAFLPSDVDESIAEVLRGIESLVEDVNDLGLSEPLRSFVLSGLRDLEEAIADHLAGNPSGTDIISVWWAAGEKQAAYDDSSNERSVLRSLQELAQKAGRLVGGEVAKEAAKELVEAASRFLLP